MAVRISKKTAQDAVYTVLKEGIMTLSLPPGTAMSTQEMATRLNVSRTPVREAFIRLQEEGLVVVFPQKQTIVSRIDFQRVLQERFIRESLELSEQSLFMEKGPKESDLEQMESEILQQETCQIENKYAEFLNHDNAMHRVIFKAVGQKLAWDAVLSVNGNYDRFRVLTIRTEDIMESAIRQHRYMISLMRQGETEKVCTEMYSHIRKMNYEKADLLKQYPDYFVTEEEKDRFQIGTL